MSTPHQPQSLAKAIPAIYAQLRAAGARTIHVDTHFDPKAELKTLSVRATFDYNPAPPDLG